MEWGVKDLFDTYFLKGVEQLGLSCSQQQAALYFEYLQYLIKWNKAYNLTAFPEDPPESNAPNPFPSPFFLPATKLTSLIHQFAFL
jgi:hypothetical protein